MTRHDIAYTVTDLHAAGEPVRIITAGAPQLRGATLLDKRRDAMRHHDAVRRHLMLEPRGHADMYGVWPTAPDHPDCALAVLFLHNEGYSTMCGHATVALGRWMIDTGYVTAVAPITRFRLQCPCGPVDVAVEVDDAGRPGRVSFDSVRAFVAQLDAQLDVTPYGRLTLDLAYGGAYYAVLPASRLGLDLHETPYAQLVTAGREIIAAGREQLTIEHSGAADLGFLYGCILTDDTEPSAGVCSRNLCIFGGGQVDRSPTGSGITARLAIAHARGLVAPGETHAYAGLSGIPFTGMIRDADPNGVVVTVTGRGHYSGVLQFRVEADDPLPDGFELPDRLADQSGFSTT